MAEKKTLVSTLVFICIVAFYKCMNKIFGLWLQYLCIIQVLHMRLTFYSLEGWVNYLVVKYR